MTIAKKVEHYNNNIKTLGKVLDQKRIALNISIRKMSEEIGINKSTLGDFLKGRTVIHPVYYNEVMKYLQKVERNETTRK